MLDLTIIAISLPFIVGGVVFAIPSRLRPLHAILSVFTSLATLILTIKLFTRIPVLWVFQGETFLRVDALAGFVAIFAALFSLLVAIYSVKFMSENKTPSQYYAYLLWTIGGTIGAAFSNNFALLLIFWGFLGFTLYELISQGGPDSAASAKKTFIIVGGSDAVMLLGISIIWVATGRLEMAALRMPLGTNLAYIAFLSLAIGAFAKAGAMPFHTWIPDSSTVAPVPVMAFLPASLDKLLGIYLLARMVSDIFIVKTGSIMSIFLLAIGAVTIIAAVMMALVQHNLKRLLAYHAVSQVGYMVLGIGTGNPIGIAGGLFHMVNHAIYKSCLFLSAGSVEKEARSAELDDLGDLARAMPITFTSCLIAALAISGVPPLNGFFSKWMVYQSLIELGSGGMRSWIIWLAVAVFGSALTLASFMKLIFLTFLGRRERETGRGAGAVKEVPVSMWLPQVVLAFLCVIFGVFAVGLPIKLFIAPSVSGVAILSYYGIWNAPLAGLLILIGIALGSMIFLGARAAPVKEKPIFVGGETLEDNYGVKAGPFYNTIRDIPFLGRIYEMAERKIFDIYEEASKGTFFASGILQWLHNGILPTYLVWCLVGMLILFFAVIR